MGIVKNTAMIGGLGVTGYAGLEAMKQGGVEAAGSVQNAVDGVAGGVVNILQQSGVQIGSLAPVTHRFIEELSNVITQSSLGDLGLAGVVGAGVGYVGKKVSTITGKVMGVNSESDDTITGVGLGSAVALGTLGAGVIGVTLASGTVGYVIGRKLGEKILGEKYAKITGGIGALAVTGLAWGASGSLILGTAVVGGSTLGIGKIIWNSGAKSRETQAKRREAKRQVRASKKRN